jgi:hypothetical protein
MKPNNTASDRTNQNGSPESQNGRSLTSRKIVRIVGWVLAGLAMACFFALIFGLLVRWLWGLTLTPLFHLAQPSYWQAVGLILLGRLLLGGFGHPHKDPHRALQHKKWHDRFEGRYQTNGFFHHSGDEKMQTGEQFRDFWESEGKRAFEAYLQRRGGAAEGTDA